MYRGTVLDNEDPFHRGRCKIFVRGVYSEEWLEAPNGSTFLPWAEPCQPLFCGGMHEDGTFQCPDVGASVWLFFESGDVIRPKFFALTNDALSGTGIKKDDEPDPTYPNMFNTDHCTMRWNDMFITFEKSTNSLTISSLKVLNEFSAITDNREQRDMTTIEPNGESGTINRKAQTTINDTSTTINIIGTETVNITGGTTVNIYSGKNMFVKSETLLDIKAPTINMTGTDITIKSDNITMNGSACVDISSPGGDCNLSKVSLVKHQHGCTHGGDGTLPHPDDA